MTRAPWILVWPLTGWLLNGLAGRRLPRAAPGWIASLAIGASLATAAVVFAAYARSASPDATPQFIVPLFRWLGDLWVDASLLIDPLSLAMAFVVTGVGLLIHIYSIGYMAGDPQIMRNPAIRRDAG